MSISVIIPVYCAHLSIKPLYSRLIKTLTQLNASQYEIIFVEDGGNDNSWEIIQSISSRDSTVHGIRLSRNYGQHNALLCGIRAARYDIVITMDDDLQNPPEEIPKLINKLSEGYDVVYGSPEKEQHSLLRNYASQVTKYILQGSMGAETARKISAFRAFRKELRNVFEKYSNPFVSIDVLLTWSTTKFTSVIVKHEPRELGTSGYTLRKLFTHATNLITGFSTLPLQLASILGFVFSLFGLMILIYILLRNFIYGSQVPGFYFLASIISIFSGAQLFALGIIGEYLARMYFSTMGRISYAIREDTENVQKEQATEQVA